MNIKPVLKENSCPNLKDSPESLSLYRRNFSNLYLFSPHPLLGDMSAKEATPYLSEKRPSNGLFKYLFKTSYRRMVKQ